MNRILIAAAAGSLALALAACGSGGGGNEGGGADLNAHDNIVPPGNVLEAPTGQGPTVDPNAGTATFDNGTEVQLNGAGDGNAVGTVANQTGR